MLAIAAPVHAIEPEPIALSLTGDAGSACLSAERLAIALGERLGTRVLTASGDAALAVAVTIKTEAPARYAVVIENHDIASRVGGHRELVLEAECEALTGPLSLVIALMIGPQQAPVATPEEPATAPAPAPSAAPAAAPSAAPAPALGTSVGASVPPFTPTLRPEQPVAGPRRFELSVGGGIDLGMLPRRTALIHLAVRRRWVPEEMADKGLPLLTELALEIWPPLVVDRSDAEIHVAGATLGAAMCSAWSYRNLTFEPCAGLWLRAMHGSADGDLYEPDWFLLSGWSARLSLRFALTPPWSFFVGLQALSSFGPQELVLDRAPPTDPFFNAPTRTDPILLDELPPISGVVLAGWAVAL